MKQILNEEFRRMQKLAGIITESQSIDNFTDALADMAIENNIISPEEVNTDKFREAIFNVWDEMGFDSYEETGQGISTSDYNQSLALLKSKL